MQYPLHDTPPFVPTSQDGPQLLPLQHLQQAQQTQPWQGPMQVAGPVPLAPPPPAALPPHPPASAAPTTTVADYGSYQPNPAQSGLDAPQRPQQLQQGAAATSWQNGTQVPPPPLPPAHSTGTPLDRLQALGFPSVQAAEDHLASLDLQQRLIAYAIGKMTQLQQLQRMHAQEGLQMQQMQQAVYPNPMQQQQLQQQQMMMWAPLQPMQQPQQGSYPNVHRMDWVAAPPTHQAGHLDQAFVAPAFRMPEPQVYTQLAAPADGGHQNWMAGRGDTAGAAATDANRELQPAAANMMPPTAASASDLSVFSMLGVAPSRGGASQPQNSLLQLPPALPVAPPPAAAATTAADAGQDGVQQLQPTQPVQPAASGSDSRPKRQTKSFRVSPVSSYAANPMPAAAAVHRPRRRDLFLFPGKDGETVSVDLAEATAEFLFDEDPQEESLRKYVKVVIQKVYEDPAADHLVTAGCTKSRTGLKILDDRSVAKLADFWLSKVDAPTFDLAEVMEKAGIHLRTFLIQKRIAHKRKAQA